MDATSGIFILPAKKAEKVYKKSFLIIYLYQLVDSHDPFCSLLGTPVFHTRIVQPVGLPAWWSVPAG